MLSVCNFFVCGVVGNKVIVVGGYDVEKKVLVIVEVFNVDIRCWEMIFFMWEECDECIGVVMDNCFYVVLGYGIEL